MIASYVDKTIANTDANLKHLVMVICSYGPTYIWNQTEFEDICFCLSLRNTINSIT